MRKLLQTYLPDHQAIRSNRWLAPFADTLLHPRLWHLNRRSAAGAVAVGMFCGLIPGPFQMLGAAICAVIFRVNLPLALFTTLYTNPLTIVPLYVVAFALGKLALGEMGGNAEFTLPPDYGAAGLQAWIGALIDWMIGLGMPLFLGLVLLASLLALVGYVVVRILWRGYLVRSWRRRAATRRLPEA
ncbi:MAG: DUF2062 domain-containing protein [Proteobacteria bacterium]|nr:DUF2062 domain-containing protein [Pseudomonadota bacterium]